MRYSKRLNACQFLGLVAMAEASLPALASPGSQSLIFPSSTEQIAGMCKHGILALSSQSTVATGLWILQGSMT